MIPAVGAGLCALSLGASCGAAPPPRTADEPEVQLGETRALEVIEATLRERGVLYTPGWDLDVGGELRFNVDLHLGTGDFGIEYVTAQDRADEPTLPPPPRTRELQILPGAGDDSRAQILLLDERAYTFDPHAEHVQAGATSAQDAEGKLARDVSDFVEYVHGQGAR
jgi:hypothetical protein